MTAFCGLLSPAEGVLHFANAGHPPPRWWHARARTLETVGNPMGVPLGISAHASFHHKRLMVEPGDVLIFHTDGVTSAAYHDECFSFDRLDQAVRKFAPRGAEAVKVGVIASLGEFIHGQPLQDDVTLVVFERRK